MAVIKIVQSARAGQSSTLDIPDEVKNDVDATYDALRQDSNAEAFAEFETGDERKLWLKQVRSYVATRETGALKIRVLPSKHLPETQLRFKITADLPANGQREANTTE